MREYRVEDHAWRLWRARGGNEAELPAAFVNALRDQRPRPHGDAGGDPAFHRLGDLQDGERAGRLSLRGVRIALSRGLAGRAEGHHHLSAEPGARRGLVGGERGAAGPRPVRARPAHPHHRRAAGGAGGAPLAAPPEARRRLALLDLYGRGARQPLRGLRRARGERRAPAVRGLGQRRADAAGAGGAGEEPLDGHARPGSRLAEGCKLDSLARTPGAPFTWRCRPTGGRCRSPAMSAPSRRWCATAATRSGSSTGRMARRRWSTRCSRGRSRSPGSTGRSPGRSTS